MKVFEIHITGEQGINDELDAMNIKNIIVELLKPDMTILRTEFMSSFTQKCESYLECKMIVDSIVKKLKSKILRVKIECPVYPEYREKSLYLETHFKHEGTINFPLSRNARSGKIMGTERTYDKWKYDELIKRWTNKAEIELCLYDDYIREDFDWFKLYNK